MELTPFDVCEFAIFRDVFCWKIEFVGVRSRLICENCQILDSGG